MKDNTIIFLLISVLADGKFYYNKQLEALLGISQTLISKYIQILQYWGIDIFIVSGKGYRLLEPIQLLNNTLIWKQIEKNSITVLPVIDSTNQYLFCHLDILHSGDVCIAEYQQSGRGRRGRKWFSPFGSNLYLSIYWRFKHMSVTMTSLSIMIGIVTAEVLHDLGANQVRIKWPNDLYLFNRKLAGILVELTSKMGDVVPIIIGIGINLSMRSVQAKWINQNWINLQEAGITIDRNMLAVRLIKELRSALEHFERNNGLASFFPRWKKLDNFINCPVKLIIDDKEIYGISRGINEQGAILLEQDGVIKPWVVGDISLRSME